MLDYPVFDNLGAEFPGLFAAYRSHQWAQYMQQPKNMWIGFRALMTRILRLIRENRANAGMVMRYRALEDLRNVAAHSTMQNTPLDLTSKHAAQQKNNVENPEGSDGRHMVSTVTATAASSSIPSSNGMSKTGSNEVPSTSYETKPAPPRLSVIRFEPLQIRGGNGFDARNIWHIPEDKNNSQHAQGEDEMIEMREEPPQVNHENVNIDDDLLEFKEEKPTWVRIAHEGIISIESSDDEQNIIQPAPSSIAPEENGHFHDNSSHEKFRLPPIKLQLDRIPVEIIAAWRKRTLRNPSKRKQRCPCKLCACRKNV